MIGLPSVRLGDYEADKYDWRQSPYGDEEDTDEELSSTPEDIIFMLGFDPLEEKKSPAQDSFALDPPVSEKQRRAMYAAANGKSNLGTPKSVGREFVGEDVIDIEKFLSRDASFEESKHPRAENGEFGFGSGSKISDKDKKILHQYGEGNSYNINKFLRDPKAGKIQAKKDFGNRASEYIKNIETGAKVVDKAIAASRLEKDTPLFRGVSDFNHIKSAIEKLKPGESFSLSTFSSTSKSEKWAKDFMKGGQDHGMMVINAKAGSSALDMSEYARFKGEEQEMLLGRDTSFQFDKYDPKTKTVYLTVNPPNRTAQDSFALDRAANRHYSTDGHLHVDETNISKANICPYYGKEIPDFESLGLEPEKTYQLLRHPDELQKAAATFNNLPLLSEHVPVSSEEHPSDLVIGSTGTDAKFEAPYLKNSLVLWRQDAIDAVENEEQKELSCAYRYRADMTPGTYEGQHYDGVMRDIVGNHVAAVERGRAGSDVLVADSYPFNDAIGGREGMISMSKTVLANATAFRMGGILGFLKPRLAVDAKPDFAPLMKMVAGKDFGLKKKAIVAEVKRATKGKIAKDASIEDIVTLVDALEEAPGGMDTEPNSGMPLGGKKGWDAVKEALKDKLSAEDMKACDEMMEADDADPDDDDDDDDNEAEDEDETEEEKAARMKAAKDKKAKDKMKGAKDEPPPFKGKPEVGGKKAVDKAAMDAALVKQAKEIRANERAIRAAEKFVEPWCGALDTAECDSEADVYKAALEARGKDVEEIHPSAYKAILEMLPVTTATDTRKIVAMDSAAQDNFKKRFPNAAQMLTA